MTKTFYTSTFSTFSTNVEFSSDVESVKVASCSDKKCFSLD